MKLLITQNNPIFATTNAIRDFGTAYKLSDINSPIEFTKRYIEAFIYVVTNSDEYKLYKAMGGGHSSELSANIRNISQTLRKVSEKDIGIARRLGYALSRDLLQTVASINDIVESTPRFMEFARTLRETNDLQQAIYNADNITTNFKRKGNGDTARAVNAGIMFNNAAIQGVDKLLRTIISGTPKERRKKFLKWIMHAIVVSAITVLYNRFVDDEGYKNLSSYKKNNFYNFAIGDGKFISLPKERENAVFNSLVERTLERMCGNEEAFFDFAGYVAGQLLPPMIPDSLNPADALHSVLGSTVLGGIADVGFNKDFKGTPIESKSDENLPSNERYSETTTKAAYYLGQTGVARKLGISPKQIDHIISSYTGIIGQANKALFPMNDERRDVTIGLRNKFISDSNYSTDMLNKIYDNREVTKNNFIYENKPMQSLKYNLLLIRTVQRSIVPAFFAAITPLSAASAVTVSRSMLTVRACTVPSSPIAPNRPQPCVSAIISLAVIL